MRPSDHYQGVDEILQADVMRFMAIIAFCLIAVLALVQTAEPALPVAAEPAALPVPAARPSVEAPVAAAPPAAVPEVTAVPEPSPAAVEIDPPAPSEPAAVEIDPAAPPEPAEAEPQAADPATSPDQGLSLRFASDQDFLRLVSRGDIQVYAFREGEVLAVGSDLRFHPAAAPGSLHELMPETIPDLMTSLLRDAHQRNELRWGVTMPERMARQIRGYVDRGVSGELIIDRFGEVRHRGT